MAVNPERPKARHASRASPDIAGRGLAGERSGGIGRAPRRSPIATAATAIATLTAAAAALVARSPSSGIKAKPASTQPATAPMVLAA